MNKTDHKEFYNSASEFYDDMVSFTSSVESRIKWFEPLLNDKMKKAADLGCGSGSDTIALSKLGLEVTGFDVSEGMIEQARKNAAEYKVHPEFKVSYIENISSEYYNTFDLVTSQGNTFANIPNNKLAAIVEKIKKIIIPGGMLVLQILNYPLILETKERIINIKKAGKFTYIRFYDFYPDHLDFNILKFETEHPESRDIITTTIYPHMPLTITNHLRECGFSNIRLFGSQKLEEFEKGKSKDVIIIAESMS